jgi:hypothetical protein
MQVALCSNEWFFMIVPLYRLCGITLTNRLVPLIMSLAKSKAKVNRYLRLQVRFRRSRYNQRLCWYSTRRWLILYIDQFPSRCSACSTMIKHRARTRLSGLLIPSVSHACGNFGICVFADPIEGSKGSMPQWNPSLSQEYRHCIMQMWAEQFPSQVPFPRN